MTKSIKELQETKVKVNLSLQDIDIIIGGLMVERQRTMKSIDAFYLTKYIEKIDNLKNKLVNIYNKN